MNLCFYYVEILVIGRSLVAIIGIVSDFTLLEKKKVSNPVKVEQRHTLQELE